MTHISRKWLRCGESICFPLTDSVPVARRKNSAPTIPDRSPVYHSCPSPRQPQLRCQLSPGSHQHTADACSPPGARPGASLGLAVGPSCLLRTAAPASPAAQRNCEFRSYHTRYLCLHASFSLPEPDLTYHEKVFIILYCIVSIIHNIQAVLITAQK